MKLGSRASESRILADAHGFRIEATDAKDAQTLTVAWDDVVRVVGYKRDCVTVDQIRFEFVLPNGESVLTTEDMSGWKKLVALLPTVLRGFPDELQWLNTIAQPPFCENLTVLYERTTRP